MEHLWFSQEVKDIFKESQKIIVKQTHIAKRSISNYFNYVGETSNAINLRDLISNVNWNISQSKCSVDY